MNKKLTLFTGVFLILLVSFVGADLVLNPTSMDFGTVAQNANSVKSITFENTDTLNPVTVSLSDTDFSYNNQFVGTYSFDSNPTYNPNTPFVIPASGLQPVNITVNVPLNTKMGQYTSTFTATYDGTETKNFTATLFVQQYTGKTGNLDIIETNSYDDVPDQIRVGRDLDINIDVENTGNTDLNNIKLTAWLYDQNLKQIVSYKESSEQTIDEGQEETFSVTLQIDDNLNEDHSYDLYVKAYQTTDELNQHDVKTKDMELLGESDLCDIGDLSVTNFDLDDDEYSPGDTIQIDSEVENKGYDRIRDVIVEVWLSERGDTKKIEKDKSNEFTLDEDESETIDFELQIDEDLDDGDYEVHIKVYEKGNEDEQCMEEVEDITIERPDNKVIIKDILITPSTLSCGGTFNAEIDIQNVGAKDDDAIKIRMYNSQLGIDAYSDTFSLERYDDDDKETIYLNAETPEDAENREYVITFTLYYDDLDEQKNYVEKIILANCNEITNNEETQEDELITTTETDNSADNSRTVYLPTGASVLDFLESDTAKTIFWVVADIALLVIAIVFIANLFRKRK